MTLPKPLLELGQALADAGVFDKMREYDSSVLPGDWAWTCTACPVQAQGHLVDGRMGYFRARGGGWRFDVSASPSDDVTDAVGNTVEEGDDPHDGFMPHAEAQALVVQCIGRAGGAA